MTVHLLLPLLAACTGTEPDAISQLSSVAGGTPVRVEIAGGAGVGRVGLPLRLVDDYGASVAGSTVGVTVSGDGVALEQDLLELDSEGYATAWVVADQPGAFQVTITSSGDGAEVGASAQGIALGAPSPAFALDTMLPPPTGADAVFAMARGTGGVALASDSAVWWMPATQGAVPWTVLTPPFSISGIRTAEVDADGVRDLVVWGEDQVVLLRGRHGGGYSWGAGWQSADMDVVGASVADTDGDLHADVVVGLTATETGRVELLQGDGVWGFTAVPPLAVDDPISDLVAADEDEDGRPDVTVMDSVTGWLHRFTRDDDGWTGGSPPLLDRYDFPSGSELLPPSDLNGDGVADIIGLASPGSGAQSIVFYILVEDTKYEQSYARMWADTQDVDVDGAADLLLMEDRLLHRIRWDALADSFVLQSYGNLATAGPTAAGDMDGDGIADLAVLDDSVVVHNGLIDVAGTWSIGARTLLELGSGFTEDFRMHDVDDDGDLDIVGFGIQNGSPAMRVWRASWSDQDGPIYEALPAAELNATGRVLDVARCDADWYVVADNTAEKLDQPNKAFRIRILASNGYVPTVEIGDRVDGSLVTCGYVTPEEPNARRFTIADTEGHWELYAYNFFLLDSGELGPVEDIAHADMDGDGLDELYSCNAVDCELIPADLDLDGTDELVRNEGQITIEGWGSTLSLDARGRTNVGDADGDGALDIIVADTSAGRIVVVPALTGALAPPLGWFTTEVISGPVHPTDYDGDGNPELIWRQDTKLVGTERSLPPDER